METKQEKMPDTTRRGSLGDAVGALRAMLDHIAGGDYEVVYFSPPCAHFAKPEK